MYLKDFENVWRVCLDCKSNIVSTANKEQKNSGFSRLVRKTEKQKKKQKKQKKKKKKNKNKNKNKKQKQNKTKTKKNKKVRNL